MKINLYAISSRFYESFENITIAKGTMVLHTNIYPSKNLMPTIAEGNDKPFYFTLVIIAKYLILPFVI